MEYFFDLHQGHLPAKADKIAAKFGGSHVNFTDANGTKRGWFAVFNYGERDPRTMVPVAQIRAAIREAGL